MKGVRRVCAGIKGHIGGWVVLNSHLGIELALGLEGMISVYWVTTGCECAALPCDESA